VTNTDARGNLHDEQDGRFHEKANARPTTTLGRVPMSALEAREYPVIVVSAVSAGQNAGQQVVHRVAKYLGESDTQAIEREIRDFAEHWPNRTLVSVTVDRSGGPANTLPRSEHVTSYMTRKYEWLAALGLDPLTDEEYDLLVSRLADESSEDHERLEQLITDEPTWTLVGDDHESRTVRAATLAEALAIVAGEFYEQYAEEYELQDRDEVIAEIASGLSLTGFLDAED